MVKTLPFCLSSTDIDRGESERGLRDVLGRGDFERGLAHVIRRTAWEQKMKRPYLEETTKTDASVRVLLLSDELLKVLKEMKLENESSLLFTDPRGGLLKYNAVQSSFNAGFKALGLPWRYRSYIEAFLRHGGFSGHKGLVISAGKPWPHFKPYDGKVCQGGRFAEQRDRGEDRKVF